MVNYKKMVVLACYIAQADMQDWDKQDIEEMVDSCGVEACIHFYKHYQNRYGIDCSRVLEWLDEIHYKQMEE